MMDLVKVIEILDWHVIPWTIVSDGHQAFADISISASSAASASDID